MEETWNTPVSNLHQWQTQGGDQDGEGVYLRNKSGTGRKQTHSPSPMVDPLG